MRQRTRAPGPTKSEHWWNKKSDRRETAANKSDQRQPPKLLALSPEDYHGQQRQCSPRVVFSLRLADVAIADDFRSVRHLLLDDGIWQHALLEGWLSLF